MIKQIAIGSVVIFIIWAGMEWVIHGILIKPLYMETKQLWRPQAEVNQGLYFAVTFLVGVAFTALYVKLISDKSMRNALLYGAIFGFAMAISHSYIDYVFMPIPYEIALSWFVAIWVEMIVASAVLGLIIKNENA